MFNIEDFKNKIFEKAKNSGFTDCEIYFVYGNSFEVQIFKGEISQYKNSAPMGLSLRGTYNNKMGYAYTENIDQSVIDLLIKNAKENATIIEQTEERLFEGDQNYPQVEGISPLLNETTVEEKINMAKLMETTALKEDQRIKSVDYSVIASGQTHVYMANSYGLCLTQSVGSAVAYVLVRAEEGNQTKVGYEAWAGKDFKDFAPEALSKKAVKEAIKQLGSIKVESGTYNILLENKMAVSIISTFIGAFYAETVQKGFSLLKDKVGEQIASDIVTIRDDISHPKSLQSLSFDSEGVAVFNKVVIENGVLKTYLYNLKAAHKENRKSTGNGFKSSFKSSIGTSCNNFYIEPTNVTFKEMVAKMENGILITKLSGLHSGTNGISGDFSLLADGFMVQNGNVTSPVNQFTIAGNFYDLLKNIKGIGDDLYFNLLGAGIGSPSIFVSNITVAGE